MKTNKDNKEIVQMGSYVTPDIKRKVKMESAMRDIPGYQIVQEALEEYFAKKENKGY